MKRSDSIKNIAAALRDFQKAMPKLKKDAVNNYTHKPYCSLSNIMEQIKPHMELAALVITQHPDEKSLTTLLMHAESGEWMESSIDLNPEPTFQKEKDKADNVTWRSDPFIDPQGIGSAITHMRRYTLAAILGLNIEEGEEKTTAQNNSSRNDRRETANGSVDTTLTGEAPAQLPWLNKGTKDWDDAIEWMKKTGDLKTLASKWRINKYNTPVLAAIQKELAPAS